MTAATRHVLVNTCPNVIVGPNFGVAPVRMIGLTKMMYDMTTNVVAPAAVSRASVVPRAAKPK